MGAIDDVLIAREGNYAVDSGGCWLVPWSVRYKSYWVEQETNAMQKMQLILLTRYLLSRLGFRLMSQESTGTSLGRLFGQAIIMFITPSTRLRVTALNILRRPPEIVKHPVPVSELVSGAGLLVQPRAEQRWRHIQPAPAPHLSALRLETAGVRPIPSNPAKCQPSMSQRSALPSLTAMVQYAEGSCSSVDFLPIF